jgi:adenylylsulfate kinase
MGEASKSEPMLMPSKRDTMTEEGNGGTDGSEETKKNITWHQHVISRRDRWIAKTGAHKGAVLWFTGLSGSGKSSVANQVESLLHKKKHVRTYLLDGDNVRHGLCSDLGFTLSDRAENIRRVGEVAKLMADSGTVVVAAFISPYRVDRDRIRQTMQGVAPFVEIWVNASLEKCESRDPKGLYQMARDGKLKNFTGIDDPYEVPVQPEITLDSNLKSVEQLANDVVQWLETNNTLDIS